MAVFAARIQTIKREHAMPIYALDGVEPQFPEDGSYWVAPNAVLIGNVRLKRNASVWFGAVLRGDNDLIELGENSNIQDNSVCHTDPGQPMIIGDNVTVGHKVILHSTTVGDGSLIGMGSTLLNRSKIGSNCLVGANSLIAEGKEFADGSLIIGSPARVARQLDERQQMVLKMSSEVYVQNYQRFHKKLKRLD
jgi:carbonic anhydrase/acetyltransferase-like protein (isoleucine patch superfamily)